MADFRHPRAKFKKTNNNKTYMKKNKEWVFENFHSFFVEVSFHTIASEIRSLHSLLLRPMSEVCRNSDGRYKGYSR